MPNKIKIGFVPLYDIHYASSRYRVFQYINRLQSTGFSCHFLPAPLFNHKKRLTYIPKLLVLARHCDVIFIQKRIFPKWITNLLTRLNDRILFDFDDAIYLQVSRREQFHHLLRAARLVITGNRTLAEYAVRYNQSIIEIPTVVDTDHYCPITGDRHIGESRILIGWIGMDPNRGDLDTIKECLEQLSHLFADQIALLIIARYPYHHLTGIPQIFIPWSLETALQSLQKIDLGIMPLENIEWNTGKCGFKLIQYSSVAAPVVASPIGMNNKVVLNGTTGYLPGSPQEWYEKLALLIQNPELRLALGKNGRIHIQSNFSVDIWFPTLVNAIEQVARS